MNPDLSVEGIAGATRPPTDPTDHVVLEVLKSQHTRELRSFVLDPNL